MSNTLKHVELTDVDISITTIGLGVWQFSGGSGGLAGFYWPSLPMNTMHEIIRTAIQSGINWFDTAEAYGGGKSEENLAKALRVANVSDNDVIIADKWNPVFRLARTIVKTIDNRLTALDGYSIDIHQIHNPLSLSPIKNQIEAMVKLIKAGKIRSVGVSNFGAKKMRKAYDAILKFELPLVTNQMKYSLLDRRIEKNGVMETAKELGIKIIAYSPLEQGLLTGKYHKAPSSFDALKWIRKTFIVTKKKIQRSKKLISTLEQIADKYNVSIAAVSLNWLTSYHEDVVVAIPGASKPSHVEKNAESLTFTLTQSEKEEIHETSLQFM